MEKKFGEESEKVLFVFDGQQAPDMESLTAKARREGGGGARGGLASFCFVHVPQTPPPHTQPPSPPPTPTCLPTHPHRSPRR